MALKGDNGSEEEDVSGICDVLGQCLEDSDMMESTFDELELKVGSSMAQLLRECCAFKVQQRPHFTQVRETVVCLLVSCTGCVYGVEIGTGLHVSQRRQKADKSASISSWSQIICDSWHTLASHPFTRRSSSG